MFRNLRHLKCITACAIVAPLLCAAFTYLPVRVADEPTPGPYYLYDGDIDYVPPGPEFKLTNEVAFPAEGTRPR